MEVYINRIEELTDNVKSEFEKYTETLKSKDGFYEAMYQLECYVYDLIHKLGG